jgi:hypothetical protein
VRDDSTLAMAYVPLPSAVTVQLASKHHACS